MKQHLEFLSGSLKSLDNNINTTMTFWARPEIKLPNMMEILRGAAHSIDGIQEDEECTTKAKEILHFINTMHWDNHCWRLHDCHFHTNFAAYVECPFTSLSEIAETVDKIIKELYNA